ncbi:acyltransferase family protein [Pseudonocardia dioxanivorans]|uniref:acyltransferase family protein n=1 Tax=Pseudonocardia dioxanivorans TaxID=240495 RepID=UPI00131A5F93|nr:acyltransferase [Pseudonocardia dioxanivorans]
MPATPSTELRALTGLRIVAAVWVVVFHFHFTGLPGVAQVVAVAGPLVTQGALGVDLFFVLSGFVIAYTYLDTLGPRLKARAAGRFVWARVARLWPAYVVVFNLFGVVVLARHLIGGGPVAFQAVQPDVTVGEWVRQLFLVQLWNRPFFDGASWVGPTWSISAEWLAYLLFPVAAVFFHRLRRLPRPILAFGALLLMTPIAASYVAIGNPYFSWSWLVRILCGFGAGVLVFVVARRIEPTPRVRRIASRVADGTVVLIAAGLCVGELAGPGRGGVVIVLFPVLVGSLAFADSGLARLLSARPLVYGGRVSYSLYLVHIPLFEVYWLATAFIPGLGRPTVPAHLVAGLVLVGAFPLAMIVHRWVEEPGSRWMRALPARLAIRHNGAGRATLHTSPGGGPSRDRRPPLGTHPVAAGPTVSYGPPRQRRPRHAAALGVPSALVTTGAPVAGGRHARRPATGV